MGGSVLSALKVTVCECTPPPVAASVLVESTAGPIAAIAPRDVEIAPGAYGHSRALFGGHRGVAVKANWGSEVSSSARGPGVHHPKTGSLGRDVAVEPDSMEVAIRVHLQTNRSGQLRAEQGPETERGIEGEAVVAQGRGKHPERKCQALKPDYYRSIRKHPKVG